MNKTLKLELTVDEVNVILEALGSLPFQQVYGIIHKIHNQANAQLEEGEASSLNMEQKNMEQKK